MKTLELKDIAAYLPYGVQIYEKKMFYKIRLLQWDNGGFLLGFLGQDGNWQSTTAKHISDVRPILRPMPDLTKKITHRGETFVPLLALANIACPGKEWSLQGNSAWSGGCFEGVTFYYDEGNLVVEETEYEDCQYRSRPATLNNSFQIFDKLAEWMFDYRGLISAGLAVDVNTLDQNPYESK